MRLPIILDCDPGHDDAVAILLALASDELDVVGITTTFGNVDLAQTTRNALVMTDLARRAVPVYPGADRPLLRARLSAEDVHGRSGLDGPTLDPPSRQPEPTRAAEFIARTVLERPGEVTLVPVGPLTNIALALRLEPRLATAVRRIVLMGGGLNLGNTTPAAEFNILCDPHAAKIVFEAGIPLTMFGLNLTHQALATPERVALIRALDTRIGRVTAELLDFFKLAYQKRYDFAGPALHDPTAVAYLVRPELFTVQPMFVEVDATDGPSAGRTNCDRWNVTGRAPNADVALTIDADGFFTLLTTRLEALGRR
ncbi:MAG: nucleoside hydrolase [Vicinamibacterales bacterium]